MSRWRVEFEFTVDDTVLAAHDGEYHIPPNDVQDWYVSDLIQAINKGFAEVEHEQAEALYEVPLST